MDGLSQYEHLLEEFEDEFLNLIDKYVDRRHVPKSEILDAAEMRIRDLKEL